MATPYPQVTQSPLWENSVSIKNKSVRVAISERTKEIHKQQNRNTFSGSKTEF